MHAVPSNPRRAARVAFATVCLWIACAGVARAQWYETYDEGVAAFERKDWAIAEEKLLASKKEADAARRQPGRRVLRFGSLRTLFIPDYYLGRVYLQRARETADAESRGELLDRAIASFEEARKTNQVGKDDPESAIVSADLVAAADLRTGPEPPGPDRPRDVTKPPVPDPQDGVRQRVERLLTEGDRALGQSDWGQALSRFQEATSALQEAPALRAEFPEVPSRVADAALAADIAEGIRVLRSGDFAAAAAAFERSTQAAARAPVSSPAARPLVSSLPQQLAEARLGQRLLEAEAAMKAGRWSAAITAYEAAQRDGAGVSFTSPRARDLFTQAPGQLRQANLQLALSERRYADALKIDPANAGALEGQYALGIAAFDAGRWEEAASAFATLAAAAPRYRDVAERRVASDIRLALAAGIAAHEAGTGGARPQFERVLALQNELDGPLAQAPPVLEARTIAESRIARIDSDVAFEAATTFFNAGRWDEARTSLQLALDKVPGRLDALDLMSRISPEAQRQYTTLETDATAALARGDLAKAESSARALEALIADSVVARDVLSQVDAIRAERSRRYMYGAFAGVLAVAPLLLVSPRRRGRLLAFIGRPAPALRLYERVLSRNPADERTLARAAALAREYKLESRLHSYFDAYLRTRPDDAAAALSAAEYFWESGAPGRAAEIYQQILASARHRLPEQVYDRLAEFYPGGLPEQTLALVEAERTRDPANPGVVRLLVRELARADRLDADALAVYKAASAHHPDDAELSLLLARALLEQGEVQEAVNHAERAIRLRGDDTAPLDVLVAGYQRSFSSAPLAALQDLSARSLPGAALLVAGERLATGAPSLRAALTRLYEQQAASGDDAERLLFEVHRCIDGGDIDDARRSLDQAAGQPPRSAVYLRALIQAHERYLGSLAGHGRSADPDTHARMAQLLADGGWWREAVSAWQGIVSIPEWNRRSMTAIQDLLDRRTLVELTQAYFLTAGWVAEDVADRVDDAFAECLVRPGADVTGAIASRFGDTQVFCCADVVSVDDVVGLKRRGLERSGSGSTVAFLMAGQAIRHDVYALIYAFMTEEPSVTLVPLEAQAVRDALVEARSRHHLERTLLQWLGHTDVFETHNPVSNAATFFGRGHFINQLVLKISRGENFGVFGMRKIGKTSLVYRLRELSRDHLVAYVDLQGVSSRRVSEVYVRLIESLVRDMRIKHPEVPAPALKTSAAAASGGDVAVDFHADLLAVRQAFETAARPLPHVLLLLDEIELMIPERGSAGFEGHQDFFRHVRGLYQQERFIVSAVVGASPSVCRTAAWEGRDNPVFQFYDEVFLAPLDRSECDQMVKGLGEVMGVRFDAGSLERIYDETSGHPYVARQLCSRLVKAFPERPLDVKPGMVDVAVGDYLAQRGDYFAGILESYLSNVARRVVEAIAAEGDAGADRTAILETIAAGGAERHLADQVLGDLELTGLARRTGDRYTLRIPLFRQWLRRSWLGLE